MDDTSKFEVNIRLYFKVDFVKVVIKFGNPFMLFLPRFTMKHLLNTNVLPLVMQMTLGRVCGVLWKAVPCVKGFRREGHIGVYNNTSAFEEG